MDSRIPPESPDSRQDAFDIGRRREGKLSPILTARQKLLHILRPRDVVDLESSVIDVVSFG